MTTQRTLRTAARLTCAVLAAWLLALACAHGAQAATPSWQYAPAAAPPPPAGVSPSQFPTNLGTVGDVEFWAPNEGLLITGGTDFVPAGLYAYDGVSWHELSTVCGSAEGRIAYASADEWWTISDQRPGIGIDSVAEPAVSLCHFVGGQVVGSYAVPIDQADSYPTMDAAACAGPDDCWFAGGFSGTTGGAFHLYWNGQTLTEVDDTTEAHAVSSMAVSGGQIYEGVTIAPTDTYSAGESQTAPAVVHSIVAGDADPFHNVVLANNACSGFCPTLPIYGTSSTNNQPVSPDQLGAWMLSSDSGSSSDPASPGQIWALAAPDPGSGAQTIALRGSGGNWSQIAGSGGVSLPASADGITAIPGQDAAVVPLENDGSGTASLDLLSSSDGGQTWTVTTQSDIGPAQGVGDLGAAGPVACPAANDCWMATSEGWLFHYTDGTVQPQSTDPVYNGGIGVITYRPPDDGVPDVPGVGQPPDDSLANQAPPVTIPAAPARTPKPRTVALVSHESTKLLPGTDTLQVSFRLAAKANVQVIALRRETKRGAKAGKSSRKGAKSKLVTVARSKKQVLGKGTHKVELRLNPKNWPTSLKLDATAWKRTKSKHASRAHRAKGTSAR